MLKNDASAAYRKKIINFRYVRRKYYRHVHRGQAIDLLQRFPVIANRLSLSLSLEGISRCRRIFGKRNTQKKRGNWTAVGLTHVRPSTSRDATLSDNRILRRCRGNGRTKEGGGHAPSNPLLSSPNPIVP